MQINTYPVQDQRTSAVQSRQKVEEIKEDIETTESDSSESTERSGGIGTSDFSLFMRTALGGEGKVEVNEEELFAALIGQRLSNESPEAAEYYNKMRALFDSPVQGMLGYKADEETAKLALQATVAAGKIDKETAELINGQAFAAAQLDENTEALFDGRGSEEDKSIAVSSTEEALNLARTKIEQMEAGSLTVSPKALDYQSNSVAHYGVPFDGRKNVLEELISLTGAKQESTTLATETGEGVNEATKQTDTLSKLFDFYWQPESEEDGNVAVRLPSTILEDIETVALHRILPADSTTLLAEATAEESNNEQDTRTVYRFSEPGTEYGDNFYVVATTESGRVFSYQIGNGSQEQIG